MRGKEMKKLEGRKQLVFSTSEKNGFHDCESLEENKRLETADVE